MAHTFTHTHRVEFADTDAAGLAHFTAFFRWMEVTEHAFYRSLGGAAFERTPEGDFGMPRIQATCEYLRPLTFGDEALARLVVKSKSGKKIEYEFTFYLGPETPAEDDAVARGTMTVVSAMRKGSGRFRSCTLPKSLLQSIEAAT
ncbi:MAG: acyl-CoA thioesterase [Longimicrobiales bacterium]